MKTYLLEVTHGQEQREVQADSYSILEDWMVFHRQNPQGGRPLEYWRIQTKYVVCMETRR